MVKDGRKLNKYKIQKLENELN